MWPSKKLFCYFTTRCLASLRFGNEGETVGEWEAHICALSRRNHRLWSAVVILVFSVPQNSYFKTLKISTQPQVAWLIILTQQLTDVHLKNKKK